MADSLKAKVTLADYRAMQAQVASQAETIQALRAEIAALKSLTLEGELTPLEAEAKV